MRHLSSRVILLLYYNYQKQIYIATFLERRNFSILFEVRLVRPKKFYVSEVMRQVLRKVEASWNNLSPQRRAPSWNIGTEEILMITFTIPCF